MLVIDVTPGVAWVEVPEVNLRILCGCPADSVKHLMRRGLIRPTMVNSTPCETGPNAILLSDIMIQGGSFSNLAEFPVLQMLYRQGMILPGHPNNNGERPLLIGRREQLDAQIQYIYRGNYGLISEEELIEAGVPDDQAHEMMRLKLRFAFGHIQSPRQLLNSVSIEDDQIEVKTGVTLRRLSLNKFEFGYRGKTVQVDLNLPIFQNYECPYPLGNSCFQREYFAVVHSGEGDGWDTRRPAMGSIVVFQGKIYLIDAGPNLSYSLKALGIGINEIEGIFHTHSHDDHFAGLTTLMRADRRIKYYAVPMVRSAVTKKLSALLSINPKDFECYFDVHDLSINSWNDVGGLDVMPVFSPHPVETTIFHFRAMSQGGFKSYAHLADIIGLSVLKSMVTEDQNAPGLRKDLFERVSHDYRIPADVKKTDIGGGLIHGDENDFYDDTSDKIIFAHTSHSLTAKQKRAYSGASFGTVDILIPSYRDFLARAAHNFLIAYFPAVSKDHLAAITNGPIRTFNPESIIIRQGQPHHSIYLLLTGLVEVIYDGSEFQSELSAGALLGEISGLHGLPATETCRAASFVQALEIPSDLYIAFVRRHLLFDKISELFEGRDFLSRTWLLGGVVSTATLNEIAENMRREQFIQGQYIGAMNGQICLVLSGMIERLINNTVVEILGPGDFYGEEGSIFTASQIEELRAVVPAVIYHVSPHLLTEIPNVRWKLFESAERRRRWMAKLP